MAIQLCYFRFLFALADPAWKTMEQKIKIVINRMGSMKVLVWTVPIQVYLMISGTIDFQREFMI